MFEVDDFFDSFDECPAGRGEDHGTTEKRRTQIAPAGSDQLHIEDLAAQEQGIALGLLRDYTERLVGDAIARNLQAARQHSLLHLVASGDARYFFNQRQ